MNKYDVGDQVRLSVVIANNVRSGPRSPVARPGAVVPVADKDAA